MMDGGILPQGGIRKNVKLKGGLWKFMCSPLRFRASVAQLLLEGQPLRAER